MGPWEERKLLVAIAGLVEIGLRIGGVSGWLHSGRSQTNKRKP